MLSTFRDTVSRLLRLNLHSSCTLVLRRLPSLVPRMTSLVNPYTPSSPWNRKFHHLHLYTKHNLINDMTVNSLTTTTKLASPKSSPSKSERSSVPSPHPRRFTLSATCPRPVLARLCVVLCARSLLARVINLAILVRLQTRASLIRLSRRLLFPWVGRSKERKLSPFFWRWVSFFVSLLLKGLCGQGRVCGWMDYMDLFGDPAANWLDEKNYRCNTLIFTPGVCVEEVVVVDAEGRFYISLGH